MPRAKFRPAKITTIYEDKVAQSVRNRQMAKINSNTLNLITNINTAMRDHIGELLREGIQEGRSVAAIASKLLATGLDRGVFRSSRVRAWMIARTELHRARQAAALDVYRANNITFLRWIAIADGRICRSCASKEGNIYDIEHLEDIGAIPPVHPRCFISPNVKIYTSKGGKRIADIEIGDLVLTHRGKFNSVVKLLENEYYTGEVIKIIYDKCYALTVTPEHPLLINNEWVEARDINVRDNLKVLAVKCKFCEKKIPYYRTFCSVSCKSKYTATKQWEDKETRSKMIKGISSANIKSFICGTRDRFKATEKARSKNRFLIENGMHNWQKNKGKTYQEIYGIEKANEILNDISNSVKNSEYHKAGTWFYTKSEDEIKEIKNRSKESQKQFYLKNPEKHPNAVMAKKGFLSKPQKEMYEMVKGEYPTARLEYPINTSEGVRFADVAILKKGIICEYDGIYWHDSPEARENNLNRDLLLKSLGWTVLHFNEYNKDYLKEIERVVKNHNDGYDFIDIPIENITKLKVKNKKLYNFAVNEEESYIANGVASHNCRCRLVPADFKLDIKVKKNKVGKVTESHVAPNPADYLYIIRMDKKKK